MEGATVMELINPKASPAVLFVSWQGGLGHIMRDIAIARELRAVRPDVRINWLAHPLGGRILLEEGETLMPESASSADYNEIGATKALDGFRLSLAKYVYHGRKAWHANALLFEEVTKNHSFDLIVGDEIYEVRDAIAAGAVKLRAPTVMIHDFFGSLAMSRNPIELLFVYLRNRQAVGVYKRGPASALTHFFVGELEDIADKSLGFLLPNKRKLAEKLMTFLGYIVRFNPAEYQDVAAMKARMGLGSEPLVVCATGGTCAGFELLELCGKAYEIMKASIPSLRMICVHGELFGRSLPALPRGVEVREYVPKIYELYAASDLAIVVGGGTTTLELTALRRPFVYFPLEGQFDQCVYISERLARQQAGIRMLYSRTTPSLLADMGLANIFRPPVWPPIRCDGARTAALLLDRMLRAVPDACRPE